MTKAASLKKYSFKIDLNEPTDPRIIQGSTFIPATGAVIDLTMNFFRFGVRSWNIQTTNVQFITVGNRTQLAILAWDRSVDATGKGNYRVEGTVTFA